MSHSSGEIFDVRCGHRVAWFEYNGTSDIAISCIHEDYESIESDWRKHEWLECKCGKPPLLVILLAHYGSGLAWPSSICLECHAIVGDREPYSDDSHWPVRNCNEDFRNRQIDTTGNVVKKLPSGGPR